MAESFIGSVTTATFKDGNNQYTNRILSHQTTLPGHPVNAS